jgi:hypothetical protein
MEINLSRSIEIVSRIWKGPMKPTDRLSNEPEVSFAQSRSLEKKLAAEPDVRPEAVERARQLVSKASYPPPEVLEKIARTLAINFDSAEH